MAIDWENFLDPYIQAVGELKIKLRGIRKQYRKQQSILQSSLSRVRLSRLRASVKR